MGTDGHIPETWVPRRVASRKCTILALLGRRAIHRLMKDHKHRVGVTRQITIVSKALQEFLHNGNLSAKVLLPWDHSRRGKYREFYLTPWPSLFGPMEDAAVHVCDNAEHLCVVVAYLHRGNKRFALMSHVFRWAKMAIRGEFSKSEAIAMLRGVSRAAMLMSAEGTRWAMRTECGFDVKYITQADVVFVEVVDLWNDRKLNGIEVKGLFPNLEHHVYGSYPVTRHVHISELVAAGKTKEGAA